MFRHILKTALQNSVESAIVATAETAVSTTTRKFVQAFEIMLPTTVFVRASQCDVIVRHWPDLRVELSANLRASFGWDLVAEQDDAGIYIVAKRKLIVGQLSTAHFTLTVPPQVNLVFHLTPGTVRLMDINGKITVPGTGS
ncbi:MAG: hypothetical protein ABI947_07450 [Chloroflexota bacterium]